MPANKTKPTGKSVEAHLAARATDQQFEDCMALIRLLKKITRKPPHMWGQASTHYGIDGSVKLIFGVRAYRVHAEIHRRTAVE